MTPDPHEAFIIAVTPEAQVRLRAIQTQVEALLPDVVRTVAYQLPAYRAGRIFFYFAAFKHHIGIYPPVIDDVVLIKALAAYRNKKGNLAFPHDAPLPLDLIGRVVVALHRQYAKP